MPPLAGQQECCHSSLLALFNNECSAVLLGFSASPAFLCAQVGANMAASGVIQKADFKIVYVAPMKVGGAVALPIYLSAML